MTPPITCFFLEPTALFQRYLRRYTPSGFAVEHYHDVVVNVEQIELTEEQREGYETMPDCRDPRWPQRCDCGYIFPAQDKWQAGLHRLYRRSDNQQLIPVHGKMPPGAMYYATWRKDYGQLGRPGPDGEFLHVILPDGRSWCPDDHAVNCTKPDDYKHKCWVRHGQPPLVTVDKVGLTCAAGAGSIVCRGWHGFLRAGQLLAC